MGGGAGLRPAGASKWFLDRHAQGGGPWGNHGFPCDNAPARPRQWGSGTMRRLMGRMEWAAEPGFARREPQSGSWIDTHKEGVRGGTMGSPAITEVKWQYESD